jgi:hypothetical protein
MPVSELCRSALRPIWRSTVKPVIPFVQCARRYRRVFGRWPNLRHPQTFSERLLQKILWDRNPRLTQFADKVRVRDYVADRIGHAYLTTLYAVVSRPEDIAALSLPSAFVMKPNHLCGAMKVVREGERIDRQELATLAATWLPRNHYYLLNEWAYKDIPPRVLFEELLVAPDGHLDDFKFWCFHGEPRLLQLDRDRFRRHRRNYYDMAGTLLPLRVMYDPFPGPFALPPNFATMIELARRLSEGVDFLRVDLYNVGGRIVFGELTNYPEGGQGRCEPASWDAELGRYWAS